MEYREVKEYEGRGLRIRDGWGCVEEGERRKGEEKDLPTYMNSLVEIKKKIQ